MDRPNNTIGLPESQSYTYEPLDTNKRSIRLLTLLPTEEYEAEIRCNIGIEELTWLSAYDALSYTWGPPSDNSPNLIYLNGYPTVVSRNLRSALRALRGPVRRHLWVDAVCINQEDNDEKSKQVPMMDLIYGKATRTLVWLGDESEQSDLAMARLASFERKEDLENISEAENEAIGRLLTRPWFSRVWVVQEFSLAKKVVFHCGSMSFLWSPIEKVLRTLIRMNELSASSRRESKIPETEILEKLSGSQVLLRLLMVRMGISREIHGGFVRERSFHFLLEKHIHLEATRPHDRIYGLLALGKSMKVKLSNSPTITYAESATNVNIAWAKWMVESSKKLDILFACQKTTMEPGLPSWAPSWKARDKESFVPNFSSAMLLFNAASGLRYIRYNLHSNKVGNLRSPKFSFSDNSQLLSVAGKQIAILDKTYQFKAVEPEYFRRLIQYLPNGYLSGESQSWQDEEKEHKMREAAVKKITINGTPVQGWTDWQMAKDYAAARKRTPARLEKLKYVVETNRVHFISKSGCEGLAPKETRVGDVLCLFKGMETPFVLRPVEETYKLIGECFVDGYMTGWGSTGKTQTYVLC
jgi:hypothetical protein